jgi:peroxiredoxin (alkyl hydroperoxide reductase subunit C)
MTARVGQMAPEFEVPAYHQGRFTTIKLADLRGKWVMLYFHPAAFTFVCGTELTEAASRYADFQKLGVEVVSFSVDNLYVHKVWNDSELSKMVEGGIPFPMGSDTAGKVGSLYGIYDEDLGLDLRGRFIIDPDGVLQAMENLSAPVGRSVDEALRQIQAFQHIRATGGAEACPAGWQPGEPVLKPAVDLIGNLWKVWKPGKKTG